MTGVSTTAAGTGLAGVQPPPPHAEGAGPPGHDSISLTLYVWRQPGPAAEGAMVRYEARGISTHMSFLEMLDVVNEGLIHKGEDPIAFDHDCREGICGMCGMVINGVAHGPQAATTTCQLHMRHFRNGDTLYVEPWRAGPFPVIKDLIVDRSALDRIVEAGGYITAPTGSATEANGTLVPKEAADLAFDNAACIACGACVAACPNGSAMLFTAAKVSHLAVLPQGQPEREKRVLNMVATQDSLGFGGCTNIGECSAVCPKSIPMESIARLNRELARASLRRGRGRRRDAR